jgi:hypothetical protein
MRRYKVNQTRKKYENMRNIVLIAVMFLFVGFSQAQNYSIKNRWNVKAGYSRYGNNTYAISKKNSAKTVQQGSSNFRIEGNYGIISCLELGLYAGIMTYPVQSITIAQGFYSDTMGYRLEIEYSPDEMETVIAPTFGLNVNFHILPLFVKKEDCRWDLYISAKYGGCFFAREQYPLQMFNRSYKHEYGAGIGGSVYFWKVFGLFAECSFGQYSFFRNKNLHRPDVALSLPIKNHYARDYFNLRGGFTFKWR